MDKCTFRFARLTISAPPPWSGANGARPMMDWAKLNCTRKQRLEAKTKRNRDCLQFRESAHAPRERTSKDLRLEGTEDERGSTKPKRAIGSPPSGFRLAPSNQPC